MTGHCPTKRLFRLPLRVKKALSLSNWRSAPNEFAATGSVGLTQQRVWRAVGAGRHFSWLRIHSLLSHAEQQINHELIQLFIRQRTARQRRDIGVFGLDCVRRRLGIAARER